MAGLTDSWLPLTLRLNNPGAIEYGPFAQSMGGEGGQRFASFPSLDAGYAALDRLLGSYRNRGLTTPAAIVNRWAPSNVDNNSTGSYTSTVARRLGIGTNDQIPDNAWPQLAEAMAGYEAGRPVPRPTANQLMSGGLIGGGPPRSQTDSLTGGSIPVRPGPPPSAEQLLAGIQGLSAPLGAPGGIGSDFAASPPQMPMVAGKPGNPWDTTVTQTPDADAIVRGATAAQAANNPAPAQPSFGNVLYNWMSSPLFQGAVSLLANKGDPTQAMALASNSQRQQAEFARQQKQRIIMDRVWASAFPQGQPNMQHPLLAGQSPQVASMIYSLGPEAALPVLAKSALERRQLEFKTAGDQAFIFDPRTGQSVQVPGSQQKAPAGYRWAENGQLEAIPGGPGEHIASQTAGQLAIMRTAQQGLPAARTFFTRPWGSGETVRNAIGGSVVAPEYDRHRRTVRLAVEGSLRAMTGAAAPQQEVDQYMEMFMPKVTDPPQIAAQKLDLLAQFMTNAEEIITRGRRQAGQQQPPRQSTRLRYDPATGELVNAN